VDPTPPQRASTFDPVSQSGCKTGPKFDVCEVPNGATVLADGGVLLADGGAGTATCTNQCTPSEYALSCYSGGTDFIPPPDPTLRCRVIPIPTPSGALFWCCPYGT